MAAVLEDDADAEVIGGSTVAVTLMDVVGAEVLGALAISQGEESLVMATGSRVAAALFGDTGAKSLVVVRGSVLVNSELSVVMGGFTMVVALVDGTKSLMLQRLQLVQDRRSRQIVASSFVWRLWAVVQLLFQTWLEP
jgi:hypothetical protein